MMESLSLISTFLHSLITGHIQACVYRLTPQVPAITTSDMTAISDSVAGAVESGNVDAALQVG